MKLAFLLCVFVLNEIVSVLKGSEIVDIFRLICDACRPQTNQCCFGTFVSPKIIITTEYCANSCQMISIENNNYNLLGGALKFNGIGLIYVPEANSGITSVKLNAVDVYSTFGLKAKIRLKTKSGLHETIIEPCSTHGFVSRYYVCTNNYNYLKNPSRCPSVQGLPLLLNERLLGITVGMNCRRPQIKYAAVNPMLNWITKSVKELESNNNNISLTTINFKYLRLKNSSVFDSETKTTSVTQKHINSLSSKRHYTKKLIQSSSDNQNFTTSSPRLKKKKFRQHTYVNIKRNTKITPTALTIRYITPTVFSTKTTLLPSTRSTSVAPITTTSNSQPTNVMDWFNKNIKNKLGNSVPPLLILTTTLSGRNTDFIDLT